MKEEKQIFTRRDFLRRTAYTAAATVLGTQMIAEGEPAHQKRSRVVLVRHPDALDKDHNPNAKVIQHMLDEGVKTLFGTEDTIEAWRNLIEPNDLIGIKSNVWAYLPTPKEVEEAIWRRIIDSGLPENRILMDDRGARTSLARCTRLINVRPLRTHYWSGIGGCLKNYIMFVRLPFRYHPNACANLGHIWTLPIVKDKTRLNVLVVLRPLFHGRGPHHYNPNYVWDYKGILVSSDPVAVDAVGVRLLSAKRRDHFGEDTPFPKLTHHVTYADIRHNIGVSDPKRIDLIKVGWTEGILI
ncbi:MAG: DUF362 domain-containing protein [Syntrophobacterales bacterium]|nr:MAG: DUF362 domain-containing protein [Syntrophobacterales bacterium]